ncbi:MAG: LON peptidase substrate-binding domain-containing protein [Bacteroidota bacterium]
MQAEIALFPLNIVVFPGEDVNLHIFEPRYKELVHDCLQQELPFGIPSYVNSKVEYGTQVYITEVSKTYDDGRMDIKTTADHVFIVEDFQNPWQDHEYAGGSVEFLADDMSEDADTRLRLLDLSKELFSWLQMEDRVDLDEEMTSYTIAHKVGLKLEEEYEMLRFRAEKERQHYLVNHLKKILPALERAEQARERIRLNGHFKHLDPLKF